MEKKTGRPSKKELTSNIKRGVVGRPKGDATIINEYKARMLSSPKSRKVLDAIFDAALDHDHKNQAAAWKLLVDRLLPMSYFEKDKTGGGRTAVNIVISGVDSPISIGGTEDDGRGFPDVIDTEELQ